jgi:hypothetical protein
MFFVPVVIFCQVLGCFAFDFDFAVLLDVQSLGQCQPLVGGLACAPVVAFPLDEKGFRLGSLNPSSPRAIHGVARHDNTTSDTVTRHVFTAQTP